MIDSDDLLAVVVLFEQTMSESTTLISLNNGCKELDVLVYDNSAMPHYNLESSPLPNLKIKYYHDPTNPGVSKAYNFAAKFASDIGKKFILLLDQDTKLPNDAMSKYLGGINGFRQEKLFAPLLTFNSRIYSPCNYFMHRGSHRKKFTFGINSLKATNFLNSGLLIDLDLFNKINGYDEAIRLYFSDFEFINRLKHQQQTYVLLDISCAHELASTDKTNMKKALTRFQYYCSDAKAASKSILLWLQYFITIGLRSCKLSIHFKTTVFFGIFWTKFL